MLSSDDDDGEKGNSDEADYWSQLSNLESSLGPKYSWTLDVKVAQSCPTLAPHGLHSPWNSPGQNTEVPFSRGSSQPRDRTQVPALQVESLPGEPPGNKLKQNWLSCKF